MSDYIKQISVKQSVEWKGKWQKVFHILDTQNGKKNMLAG